MNISPEKLWFYKINQIDDIVKLNLLYNGINEETFYKMGINEYINLGINIIKAEGIAKDKNMDYYNKLVKYIDDEEIKVINYFSKDYPEQLKCIDNPPLILFIKGEIPNLNNSLGIVGSRKATGYGKNTAYKFSYDCASNGILIISGMARGIDTMAHRGAIDAGGKTIAIMGSGFKRIYPSENRELFNEITQNGCVISEFFPEIEPFAYNFPRRNRIISGLSRAILVVEADIRSGSLITATHALNQGKDVFSIPGNIFSSMSRGTNKLIQDGAKLIMELKDILDEFGISINKSKYIKLSDDENRLIKCIEEGLATPDEISDNIKIDISSVLMLLTEMECKGIVKRLYNNQYILSNP